MRTLIRRTAAPALAATVASLSVVGVVTPAHAATDGSWILEGKVVLTKGSRAVIQPAIWPNVGIPAGSDGIVPMLDLPEVYTESGSYRIEVLPSAVPADYINDDGTIAMRLVVSNGTTAEIQETPVAKSSLSTKSTSMLGRDRSVSIAETVDFVNPQIAPQVKPDDPAPRVLFRSADLLPDVTPTTIQRATVGESVVVEASSVKANVAAAPAGGSCYIFDGPEHGPYKETFAKVYGGANVKGSVDQYKGSSHTIGIAAKGSGNWGATGSASVSVTSSAGYTTDFVIADAAVANMVKQKYYYTKCQDTPGKWTTVATQSKPIRIESGPEFTRIAHTNYSNCSTGYVGVNYFRDDGTNGAISGGMDLPFINLSAQAGWTSKTTVAFKFKKKGKLCGSNGGWMVAKAISATA